MRQCIFTQFWSKCYTIKFALSIYFRLFICSFRRGGSIAKSAQELSLALQDFSWVKCNIGWISKIYIFGSNHDVHMEWLLELWSCLCFYLAELAFCMYIPAKTKTLTTHILINWLLRARGQLDLHGCCSKCLAIERAWWRIHRIYSHLTLDTWYSHVDLYCRFE